MPDLILTYQPSVTTRCDTRASEPTVPQRQPAEVSSCDTTSYSRSGPLRAPVLRDVVMIVKTGIPKSDVEQDMGRSDDTIIGCTIAHNVDRFTVYRLGS